LPEPFSNILILDFSEAVSGPYCTKLLGAFGAEVIKIEKPPAEDSCRQSDYREGRLNGLDISAAYLYLNTNKKSVSINLKDKSGLCQFLKLVEQVDVLVENHPPGTMKRLGLNFERLSATNRRLIMASISDFGQTGPYRHFKGGRLVHNALSGHAHLCGDPEREPLAMAGEQPAYQAGLQAFIGIVSALCMRLQTGKGQYIDISIHECMTSIHQFSINSFIYSGRQLRRTGNRSFFSHPSTVYPSKDGSISITVTSEDHYRSLLRMMQMEEMLEDDRFKSTYDCLLNADAFDDKVKPWFRLQTSLEIVEQCQLWRIPAASLNDIQSLLKDPQLKARHFWQLLDHPKAGAFPYASFPFRLSATPLTLKRAPLPGEHNAEILLDSLKIAERKTGAGKSGAVVAKEIGISIDESTIADKTAPAAINIQVLPLQGIRVLDLTHVWSGPLAARILADLGAEVITVQSRKTISTRIPRPDLVEAMGIYPDNQAGTSPWKRSALAIDLGRNKKSMTLELNTPQGKNLFVQLVKKSDVVIENFSPRVMSNFGLDYRTLAAHHPPLIMCSMPGYGLSGPNSNYVSFGPNLELVSGLASLMGYDKDDVYLSGSSYPDPAAAMHAASAILAALYHRHNTGTGQLIDLAQSESTTCLIGEIILEFAMKGRLTRPGGNRHAYFAPCGCYPTRNRDEWVMIEVKKEEEWQALASILSQSFEIDTARFLTHADRMMRHDELDEIIRAWTADKNHRDAMKTLQQAGVPAGAVLNAAELVADPQLQHRKFYWTIDHPEVGFKRYCGQPIHMSAVPDWPKNPAPCLGEQNFEILNSLLGYSEADIRRFEENGIIGTEPMDD